MAERLNMAEGSSPGPEGPPTPSTDEELLSQPVGARVRHVLGLPESKQAAAIKRLGLEIGGGADTEPALPKRDWGFPENIWGPEFRERGIRIATDIVSLEAKPDQDRYSTENGKTEGGKTLDNLYEEWKAWVGKNGEQSFTRKPFNLADLEPTLQQSEVQKQPEDPLADDIPSFAEVLASYNNPASPEALAVAKGQLSRYFTEAKRMGLLNGIDESLRGLYAEIMQGMEVVQDDDGRKMRRLTKAQLMTRIENDRQAMSVMGKRGFKALKRLDLEDVTLAKIAKLEGVWDEYVELAVDKFALLLNGGGLIKGPHIAGEFTFDIEGGAEGIEAFRKLAESREVYWRPTYANYFEVSARTPEQFQVAVDTFTQWLRSGLTKSPNEIFQRVGGFKDALTTAGVRERAHVTTDFMAGLRRELEGLVGILGADWANEHYNPDYYKQFLTFAAQDEGPDRFVRLSRANKGKVAAVLWKFDKDPRFELLFSPHGSRGQLMKERNPVEQRELIAQIQAMLIAEIMGIGIKEYHPDDSGKREGYLEENLNEIAKFQSDEKFRNLFEGFDREEQEALLQRLESDPIIQKIKHAKWVDDQYRGGVSLVLTQEQTDVYNAWKAGELIKLVNTSELQTWERLERARRIQDYLQAGKDPAKLEGEEKTMYEEAKSAFTLAYELYGAMGEKAKRSGGVFLVDRNIVDAEGHKVVDYVPIHWAEKFVQFAENWTKVTYGDKSAAEVKKRVAQARKMAIAAIKKDGFDAKLLDVTFSRNGQIIDPETFLGLDQYKQPLHSDIIGYTQDGRPITFFAFFSNIDNPPPIYDKPTGNDRQRVVFNNLGPMLLKRPRILGYSQTGQPVIVLDNEYRPIGLGENDFDGNKRAIIYDKPRGDDRKRINLDDLDRGVLTKRDDGAFVYVEEVPVDFQTATHHLYSRWTSHPYWGYQEEDTGLLLTRESFEQAQQIKEGKLRPEDARPHAVQLLIVDPTLNRVRHLPHQENREDKIVLAAVEDSYQSHWRITDQLHQAYYPADANDEYNRITYNLQDQGGSTKEWFHARAEAARWTNMKTRRLRTMIPVLPLHITSMAEMWGAPGGALDVLRMMNYKQYRMVGQFALEKWINQTEAAQDLYEALFGYVDPQGKRSREGLGEKPTNDADALQKWSKQVSTGDFGNIPGRPSTSEEVDNQFVNAVRESLNRFEIVYQRIRVLETDKRGERTPLWLEGVEIFLKEDLKDQDGKIIARKGDFNPKIDELRDVGSSRHSGEIFFWRFVRWLRSDKTGEGVDLYPTEALYYKIMDENTLASVRATIDKVKGAKLQTRWEWLLTKLNR